MEDHYGFLFNLVNNYKKIARIDLLLARMEQLIVTVRTSNLNQANEDLVIIRAEMEAFRPAAHSDSDSSSEEAESGEENYTYNCIIL